MSKDRTIFHELLALDSIYHVLKLSDRIFLHRCIAGKVEDNEEGYERIYELNEILKRNRWKSPKMKYPEFHPDQLYYDEGGEWILLEHYKMNYPKLTEQFKNFLI